MSKLKENKASDDFAELKGLILDLAATASDMKAKLENVETLTNSVKATSDNILKDILNIKAKCAGLEEENVKLIKKVDMLEKEVDYLKVRERAKNLIIYNVQDTPAENIEESVMEIFNKAEINIAVNQIENIKRLGSAQGKRPIMVTLSNSNLKRKFFQNVKKIADLKLSVGNDLSKQQREDFKKLVAVRNQLKSQGITSRNRKNKLVAGEKEYDLRQARDLLEAGKYKADNEAISDSDQSNTSITSTKSRKRFRNKNSPLGKSEEARKKYKPQNQPTQSRRGKPTSQ